MTTAIETELTRFHLSLSVNDLDRSIRFLRALLGVEPSKRRNDYAKFELDNPPLVLTLEPCRFSGRGALNHLGFRMPDSASLVEAQRRLAAAGIETQREEGVECCYARQTKFWATDPDGSLWEVYVFEGDIEHRGQGQPLQVVSPTACCAETPPDSVTLSHYLGLPFSFRQDDGRAYADGAADEVLLQGTFNARLGGAERAAILAEVLRVLRPGGQLLLHMLTAATPLPEATKIALPGPASVVEHVPVDRDLVSELAAAGFVDVRYWVFGAAPCFHYQGVELRETKLLAYKPAAAAEPTRVAMYKGPFRELRDDAGRVFRRGERVGIDAATCERLKAGPAAEQFLLLDS